MPTIKIELELTDDEAAALAQFLKRSGFTDYKAKAESEADAYLMRDAGDKVREALAGAGYAPR